MTEDERQELRERVARTVMHWHSGPIEWAYDATAVLWHRADGVPLMPCGTWRPDADDAQAMQVLDALHGRGFTWLLGAERGTAFAQFTGADGVAHRAEHADRRVALLRAALAASM